ncbi:MAG TPA: hypothetical protein VJ937_09445 [Salinivirga sp.]|uniref:hypothetical protein n=1 Tax=Salinivirga sp. TaxID=1970192 RepID=UPI002B4A6793|nr:hypothetical protein [Salinivirga sp.]HKK59691.1 hypothetical protein [Salinivirga sp.]
MEKENLKPEESLSIIKEMVETEKIRFGENGFIYRFWGWMVIAAATLQYLLMYIDYQHHYYAWFLMLVGGVYTGIYYSRSKNQVQMPLSGKLMAYTWSAIGLNIFIVSFILPQTAGEMLLLFILSFIGIGTIISGAMLRFPIMIVGGILCNALGFVSLLTPFEYWGLYSILAITFADLIPGYVLKAKFQKQNV